VAIISVQETCPQAFAQEMTLRGAPFLNAVHARASLHARQLLAGHLEVEDLAGEFCDGRSTWRDEASACARRSTIG
jgi:hypothetical protein